VNLREWALSQGIHPQTAYRWHRQGKLPVPAQKMGKLILVGDLEATTQASPGRAAGCPRSHELRVFRSPKLAMTEPCTSWL